MSKALKTQPPESLEAAMAELEKIVSSMEDGELPLERSLAGYKRGADGRRFRLRMVYNAAQAGFNAMAEIARDNWKALGVELSLEPAEFQVVLEKVFKKPDFDVSLQPYTTAGDPAIGIARAYVTMNEGRPFTNPTGYSNPKLDGIFAQAATVPDRQDRRRLYFEAQRIIAEDLPRSEPIESVYEIVCQKRCCDFCSALNENTGES